MKKVSLLVADTDEAHIKHLGCALEACQDIELTCAVRDGRSALNEIDRHRPDVLLADILLPGMDGLTLLKDLQTRRYAPATIVCTRFYSDSIIEIAHEYGAQYLMYKPIDYRRVPEVIRACCRHGRSEKIESAARTPTGLSDLETLRNMLCALGIPSNLNGSQYLIEILLCMDDDAQMLRNLSKGAYDKIAKKLSTTPQRVERSIRTAIAIACERGPIREVFHRRPTNREFIQYLLQQANQLSENADSHS